MWNKLNIWTQQEYSDCVPLIKSNGGEEASYRKDLWRDLWNTRLAEEREDRGVQGRHFICIQPS